MSVKHTATNGWTYDVPSYDGKPSLHEDFIVFSDSMPDVGNPKVVSVTGAYVVTSNDMGRVLAPTASTSVTIPTDDSFPVGSQFGIAAGAGVNVQVVGAVYPGVGAAVQPDTLIGLVKVADNFWLIGNSTYAAGNAGPPPPNPEVALASANSADDYTVTITNYDAANEYQLAPTVGSAGRTGDTITWTGASSGGTLYVRATLNGGDPAGPASFVVTPFTYNRSDGVVTRWYEHDGGSHGNGPTCGSSWSCTYYPTTNTSGHNDLQITCGLKDYTPSGWTDNGFSWHKEINP